MSERPDSLRALLLAFAALLALTAATVAAAYVDLGPWNDFTALAIAGAKVAVVALVFMHLSRSARMLRVVAVGALLWLLLLLGLTLADYLTRPPPLPGL